MKNASPEKKIVIVGGGFGGIQCALNLSKLNLPNTKIQLVTDKHYFDYHAALYRLVSGRSPLEACIPLPEIFKNKNVDICIDFIVDIYPDEKFVLGKDGIKYHYDHLVLAVGGQAAYFGIPGVKAYSFKLKDINDALKLRKHLEKTLYPCPQKDDEKSNCAAHIVVIGGGATGVELSGELAVHARKLAKRHSMDPSLVKIDLIERSERVLPMLSPDISEKVKRQLQNLGVEVFLNKEVIKEDFQHLYLKDSELEAKTVIWTAGIAPNELVSKTAFSKDNRGRIKVDEVMRPQDLTDNSTFILGDIASTRYAGMAQTALEDGAFVSAYLGKLLAGKSIKNLSYLSKPPVYAIPVGPGWAVYVSENKKYFGKIGWFLRRFLDLQVMMRFLPFNKAFKSVRYGGVIEDCDMCAS